MISRIWKEAKGRKIGFMFLAALFAFCGVMGQPSGWAQEKAYPSKTVKIVSPYEPGAKGDIESRLLADYIAQELKVPVVVENKAGAGGMIGANDVHRSKPDGYTLLGCGDSVMTLAPFLNPNPPFDPLKDFTPLCSIGVTPVAFGVEKSSPFKSLSDFVKEAKANPGKFTVGVPQLGNVDHLLFEIFRKNAGVDVKLVPFKGTGEMISSLLGKHIDLAVLSYVGFLPYVKSGEARLLVATSAIPGSSIPNFAKAGYPDVVLSRMDVYFVSAKTPKPIYDKLVVTLERVAKNPDVAKKLEGIGVFPEYSGPAEVSTFMKKMTDAYSAITDELGLKKKK